MKLYIITENDGKTINGLASKDDMRDIFGALIFKGQPGVPPVDMALVTVAEFERIAAGQNVNGERMPGAKRPASTPPMVLTHDIKGKTAELLDYLSGELDNGGR